MNVPVAAVLVAAIFLALSAWSTWDTRRKRLARIRTEWGRPRERRRDMDGVADFFLTHEAGPVFHLGDAIGPNGLTFDYRLTPGPETSRNAIALLNGAPESLVAHAFERAAELDRQRQLM
jgi:hypothetical protein